MTIELTSEISEHVLTLSINRPQCRNALNAAVIASLKAGLLAGEQDPNIRAIVLTAAGTEAFCAGADLQSGDSFQFDYSQPNNEYANLLRIAKALTTPLVAKVNGACMAGGMGLLAMCDLAVAATHATFALPEVMVGVFPMQVLSVLQGIIPERWLVRMCLTGEAISAGQALEIGLVNEVSDQVDEATETLVTRIARGSPAAIKRGLYALKHNRALAFESSMAFTESQIALVALTADAKEGLSAFKEKRKPVWPAR